MRVPQKSDIALVQVSLNDGQLVTPNVKISLHLVLWISYIHSTALVHTFLYRAMTR